MATTVPIPDQAVPYVTALQNLLASNQAKLWAASLAYCLGSLELGFLKMAHACLEKLVFEFAAYMDATVGPIIDEVIAGLGNLVADLQFILDQIGAGELDTMEAIDALLELGVQYPGAQNAPSIESFVGQYLQLSQTIGGGHHVATAVAPIPVVPGTCGTKRGTVGICCTAVTQLGLARAAQGFQYVDCNGKTRCLACGTKASVSPKKVGQTVFSVKRVSCGPSGCPALGQVQGQIITPV